MTNMTDPSNAADRALLARLNALKKSTIELETKGPDGADPISQQSFLYPAPARALHSELLSQLKPLTRQTRSGTGSAQTNAQILEEDGVNEEDVQTVENLLAELGPESEWNLQEDETTAIEELLRTAKGSLREGEGQAKTSSIHDSSVIDATDESLPKKSITVPPEPTDDDIEREAEEYLAQVLEQIKHAPTLTSGEQASQTSGEGGASKAADQRPSDDISLPSAPAQELEPPSYVEATADDELASRLAQLGLPSVPTVIKSNTNTTTPKRPGPTDEEIDSWCTICNDDANLRCIGCDGDLYCTKCWLEGHKGPDAGYEERKHRAIEYNKGGGLKKQPGRRALGV